MKNGHFPRTRKVQLKRKTEGNRFKFHCQFRVVFQFATFEFQVWFFTCQKKKMFSSNMISNFLTSVTRSSGNSSQAGATNAIRYSAISSEIASKMGRNFVMSMDIEETVTCFCRWANFSEFFFWNGFLIKTRKTCDLSSGSESFPCFGKLFSS